MSDHGIQEETKSVPGEKKWVQFNDENISENAASGQPAVIDTETVEIVVDKVKQQQTLTSPEPVPQKSILLSRNSVPSSMRNINLNDEENHSAVVETSIPRGFGK